jgi:hypothetical protein
MELLISANPVSDFTQADRETCGTLCFYVNDPDGKYAKLKHELTGLANKFDSGGSVDCHVYAFSHDKELVQWFHDRTYNISMFLDAVVMLHYIGATILHTQESTRAREAAKNISLDSYVESSIRDSFDMVLPSILVGNKKETNGGAYECLVGYTNHFTIWYPRGAQCSSGLRARIQEGTKTI